MKQKVNAILEERLEAAERRLMMVMRESKRLLSSPEPQDKIVKIINDISTEHFEDYGITV